MTNDNPANHRDHGDQNDGPQVSPTPACDNAAPAADVDSSPGDACTVEDVEQAWVESWYGDPPAGRTVIDPDTPEGAAIIRLFRWIKEVEEPDGSWPGGDVVQQLTDWFTSLGIDPDEPSMDAGQRLRLQMRNRPGGSMTTSVFGLRVGTEHDNPQRIIEAALTSLARQLGPGTGVDLVSFDRELLTRIEQPAASPSDT